jgi:hypothetical protein
MSLAVQKCTDFGSPLCCVDQTYRRFGLGEHLLKREAAHCGLHGRRAAWLIEHKVCTVPMLWGACFTVKDIHFHLILFVAQLMGITTEMISSQQSETLSLYCYHLCTRFPPTVLSSGQKSVSCTGMSTFLETNYGDQIFGKAVRPVKLESQLQMTCWSIRWFATCGKDGAKNLQRTTLASMSQSVMAANWAATSSRLVDDNAPCCVLRSFKSES